MADSANSGWDNPSARPSSRPRAALSDEEMAQRVRDLEALCADVYVAGVEVGLPRALLNRLWVVAGRGGAPQAFAMDDAAAEAQATSSVPVGEPDVAPLEPLAQRRVVLVADDDPRMIDVLVRILARENYEIIARESGPAALDAVADRSHLDLLVTDVAMPEMTGPQLAARLRERFPQLAILFQTGFSDMLFEGCDDLGDRAAFLEKPFTARGLLEAARLVMLGRLSEQAD
jgi:CheY-like chemotaxis protein